MQLFVEQLTNVDFSYLDAKRGLVGETWWASAVLDGALDEQGMVCDFGIVKKTLRNWLDDELDHRLLLPVNSPALTLKHSGDIIELSWHGDNGDLLEMRAPRQAVALVDAEQITAKSVAHWCREQLRSHFPVNVEQLTLSFVAETIDGASYHYSHGLKKHNGNCQRIAHGHRSRIQIWLDDERSSALEQQWAERWADIYLGSKEDLISEQDGQLLFRYSAQQGEFELSLPASRNYMMNTDTTVEFIARHLADTIKQQHPDSRVKVRAFEGVNKGAIANA
ncbi:6-pyruvoyl trahydropterin synthase family protein [Thalassolituus pacificus]|uniref:6-carboxy-5,6,7,8-tetrahydropterin synthase n=1 Tax=Thalassolituus pacificus TaxID=2975440 RepID=A0A9X2WH13_9GAMM|nr:6-carboxytetrahydropterin synthase [Thalassolituus pacificus]MCT7359607.1 6-carboxytetrahydropterin synthase [Thalassolituus pacificus]